MPSQFFLERRAARAFGLKDYGRALDALSDLLSVVGENANTLHATAICHQRLGHDDKALDFAERGIIVDPSHLGCLEVLTEIHAARGNLDAATVFAKRALKRIDDLSAGEQESKNIRTWLASMFTQPGPGAPPRISHVEWIRWASELVEEHADVGNP